MTTPFYAGSAITAAALNQLPVYSYVTTGSQTINSTTPATVTGLSQAVLNGQTWRVRGVLSCVQGATSASQNVRFSGPAISSGRVVFTSYNNSSSAGLAAGNVADIGATFFSTPAWTNGTVFFITFDGVYTFTANGTLAVTAAEGTNLDTFSTAANSFADFWQSPP